MGRASSTHGEMRNEPKIEIGKSERKRPLFSPKHKWKDNIKM
jgi:hypothetical protein